MTIGRIALVAEFHSPITNLRGAERLIWKKAHLCRVNSMIALKTWSAQEPTAPYFRPACVIHTNLCLVCVVRLSPQYQVDTTTLLRECKENAKNMCVETNLSNASSRLVHFGLVPTPLGPGFPTRPTAVYGSQPLVLFGMLVLRRWYVRIRPQPVSTQNRQKFA